MSFIAQTLCRLAVLLLGLAVLLITSSSSFSLSQEDLFSLTPEREGRRELWLTKQSKDLEWSLRLPERMFSDETVLVGHDIQRVQTPVQWRWEDNALLYRRSNTDDGGGKRGFLVDYSIRLEPQVDGVAIEFTVQNTGASVVRNVVGHVCLGHRSDEFRDPGYERTYIRSNGRFLSVRDTDRGTNPIRTHYLVKEMRPIKIFNNPQNRFWGKLSDIRADNGLILTRSKTDQRLVALFFESASELFQNSDDRNMCIHSDPNFGDLRPGFSKTHTGKVVLFEGDLRDFEKAYLSRLHEQ